MTGRAEIRNQTVLLIGATGALGQELARILSERHCRLALIARDHQRLAALQAQLSGGTSEIWTCDIRSRAAVATTHREIVRRLGQVDVAIFASGIGTLMNATDFSASGFENVLRTNLLGVTYWLDSLLPDFLQRRAGMVIGISSLAAGRGFPNGLAYCPSKAGVSTLFECLRTDLSPLGIRVHLAEPGFFLSAMTQGLPYTPFIISARRAARELLRGVERGQPRIRFPASARMVASCLRMLPPGLFDKIMGSGHPMRSAPTRDLDLRGSTRHGQRSGESG